MVTLFVGIPEGLRGNRDPTFVDSSQSYMYGSMHAYNVCMYAYNECMYASMRVCVDACMHACICMYIYICVCVCVCMITVKYNCLHLTQHDHVPCGSTIPPLRCALRVFNPWSVVAKPNQAQNAMTSVQKRILTFSCDPICVSRAEVIC